MESTKLERLDKIARFLQEGRRNRLIILDELKSVGARGVDVGQEMAAALEGKENAKYLPALADDALKAILDKGVQSSPAWGTYLGLTNLGILFEPELRLDVLSIFDRYSQNNTLFVEWPGEQEGERLFFISKHKGKQLVLQGMSFLKT
jgi:hypothetical protein